MKRTILSLFWVIFLNTQNNLFAQQRFDGITVVCPAGTGTSSLKISAPEEYLERPTYSRVTGAQNDAQIIVTYTGFDEFPQAQAAYQFAVDIWSSLLHSDMPIYLDAGFTDLGGGILAQAGPTSLWSGFDGALNDSTIYHVALAEKMARRDFNTPGEADINASFNSTVDWYFGTDGNVPGNQQEFVATVLHEIGHGLGFSSLDNYDPTNAIVFPGSYNNYIVDGSGASIYSIPNNSSQMASYLTSEDLFLNSPSSMVQNGGAIVEIYAPAQYNGGSSISHIGESFNGTDNACMTFSGTPGESIHHPGSIVISFFEDMGWISATLIHQEDRISEGFADDIVLTLEIKSDLALLSGSDVPQISYSFDGFATQVNVLMTDNGSGNFTQSITNPGSDAVLEYYFTGIEDELRSYRLPVDVIDGKSVANPYRKIIRSGIYATIPFTLADGGNFETGGVFVSMAVNGPDNKWELGIPSNVLDVPSSGSQVWKTDLDGNIAMPLNDIVSGIVSPKFDLSDPVGDYNLSFDLRMDSDNGAIAVSVIYTIDGGLSWETLGEFNDPRGKNWYNFTIDYLPTIDDGWVLDNSTTIKAMAVSYSLTELLGESEVYFAILAGVSDDFDLADYGFDGAMIDDFQITKTTPTANFISSASEGLVFPGETVDFEFISSGADSFNWDFGDGTPTSDLENPSHEFVSGGDYTVTLTITYPGGTHTDSQIISVANILSPIYLVSDGGDFESNFSDFVADNLAGTGWERGSSTVSGKQGTASGDNAWVTGLSAAQYVDQSESFLYTPLFDFGIIGEYLFTFKANYQTETGWDGFTVEFTIDNGASWNQLDATVAELWYDRVSEANTDPNTWNSVPIFTGTTNGSFQEKSRDISFLAGNDAVGFRFHWLTDHAETDVGVAIDDFELTGPTPGPAEADFSYAGNTGCAGQQIVFTNASSGSISSIDWDFGTFATPQSAMGAGPHTVTYDGDGNSSVTLTLESPINGTVVEIKTDIIATAALHDPSFTEEDNGDIFVHQFVSSVGDSYQWFLDGTAITGATMQEYSTEVAGSYGVEVTINGCAVLTDELSVVSSIEDNVFNKALSIYPNPSEGYFTLRIENEEIGFIRIVVYSITGEKLIKVESEKRGEIFFANIDMSSFSQGTYLIEVSSGESNVVKRLLLN